MRSVPGEGLSPSPEELTYQQQWLERLQLSETELARRRCMGVGKGVVVTSAQREQEALDAELDGFYAGAFTYLMTQYLWQQTDTVGNAIAQITRSIKRLSSQVPLVDGDRNQSVYFINKRVPPTDAVITKVEGNQATLWLGGVDKESLEAFQAGAMFTIIDERGQASGKVKLLSRSGLIGEGRLVESGGIASLQPGMLLQEISRVIPADLKLYIGVDPSLETEGKAAEGAIEAISRLEVVPAQLGNVPYPGGVHYIFSRMTADYWQRLSEQEVVDLPAVGSIGLFTPGLELVPQSFGEAGEVVKIAVERLEPKLKSLLATRIIKQTLNANSSQLDVEVSMLLVEPPNQVITGTATGESRSELRNSELIYPHRLPVDKLFQFRVTNHESSNLYLTVLLIDSSGGLVVVFPYQWPASEESMQLRPNQTLVIGEPQQLKLKAIEKGTGEALVIVSRSPLKKAVKTLVSLAAELNREQGVVELPEPVEVIGDLLDDLSERAGVAVRRVSVSEIATLSLTFEVG